MFISDDKIADIIVVGVLLMQSFVCVSCLFYDVETLCGEAKRTSVAKLTAALELMEQLHEEGHKVLFFSQFVSMLKIVRSKLEEMNLPYHWLTGSSDNRADIVKNIPVQRFTDIMDYHSSVEDAAQTAARQGVRTLVLTHPVPAPPIGQGQDWVDLAAAHFDGEIILAEDMTAIEP
jgi:hypothetical protein